MKSRHRPIPTKPQVHKTAVEVALYHDFKVGERVVVKEGYQGTVQAVHDGPRGGDETYFVELDGGMGQGEWGSTELRQAQLKRADVAKDSAEVEQARCASEDYPDLAEILLQKPPPTIWSEADTYSSKKAAQEVCKCGHVDAAHLSSGNCMNWKKCGCTGWRPRGKGKVAKVQPLRFQASQQIKVENTPLPYPQRGKLTRLAIYDSSAPPPSKWDKYFHEGNGQQSLAEQRKGLTPIPGLVAFLDFDLLGSAAIDLLYVNVRPDYRGKGLARKLIAEAYKLWPEARCHWGKLMQEEMGTLYRSFQETHPDRTYGGSNYYGSKTAPSEEGWYQCSKKNAAEEVGDPSDEQRKCPKCGGWNGFHAKFCPFKTAASEANEGLRRHKLLPQEVARQLPSLYSQENNPDPMAVVKFFSPYGSGWRWFATEFDPTTGTFFGLVQGAAEELGYFSLQELAEVTVMNGVPAVERDMYWTPKPLSSIKGNRLASKTEEPCSSTDQFGGKCVYQKGHVSNHRYEGGDSEGRHQKALNDYHKEKGTKNSSKTAGVPQDALGFSSVVAVDITTQAVTQALNAAAEDRGIKLNKPSDELDLSLDMILLEMAASLNANYDISDDTLRVWPTAYGSAWPIKESKIAAEDPGNKTPLVCSKCGYKTYSTPYFREHVTSNCQVQKKASEGDPKDVCAHCGGAIERREHRVGVDWFHIDPEDPEFYSQKCEDGAEYAEPAEELDDDHPHKSTSKTAGYVTPEWLRERVNDPYGTPNKNEFWNTVDVEKIGDFKIFEKDGIWFLYSTRQNYWMHFNSEQEARESASGDLGKLDMWAKLDMWTSRKQGASRSTAKRAFTSDDFEPGNITGPDIEACNKCGRKVPQGTLAGGVCDKCYRTINAVKQTGGDPHWLL